MPIIPAFTSLRKDDYSKFKVSPSYKVSLRSPELLSIFNTSVDLGYKVRPYPRKKRGGRKTDALIEEGGRKKGRKERRNRNRKGREERKSKTDWRQASC